MSEINQARDILTCIAKHGPITAEQISNQSGYIRYVIDVALPLLIERSLVCQSGITADQWQDPLYSVIEQQEQEKAK